MKKNHVYNLVFILLIVLFGIFTTIKETQHDLWFDEAYTFQETQKSYRQIAFQPEDVHPPLYYLSLKLWSDISSYSIRSQRSFSFLMFMIYMLSMIYIIRKLFGKGYEYMLMMILLSSSTIIMYSEENRMYMMGMVLVLWSYYNFIKGNYKMFVFVFTLAMYTHYYNCFVLIPLAIHTYLDKNITKKSMDKILYSLSYIVMLCTPLVLYFVFQKLRIDGMWLQRPSMISLITGFFYQFFIPYSDNTMSFIGISEIILMFTIYTIFLIMYKDKKIGVMITSFLFTLILVILFAYIGVLPYHHRYLMSISFLLYIPLSYGIEKTLQSKDKVVRIVMIIFLVLFFVLQITQSFYYFTNPNQELQIIGKELNDSCRVLPKNILHESAFSLVPMMVYSDNCNHYLKTNFTYKQMRSSGGDVIPDSNINNETVMFDYYVKSQHEYLSGDTIIQLEGISLVYIENIG